MTNRPGHLLVTGGAGFIGSAFVRNTLRRDDGTRVTVLDKLTYAGQLSNLVEVDGDPRFRFVRGDIADPDVVDALAAETDVILNFAAESHVDRSIESAQAFVQTEIVGTLVLLEAARRHGHRRFVQVSTDEVYGDVPAGSSTEADALRPRSPYAAAKAAADLLALAFHTTHDLPVVITRGSNTFGPHQYPEKIIPLFVTNAIDDEPLPLYADGLQVRDWLYVDDHCAAIALALRRGEPGTVYNVGGGNERSNLDLTRLLLDMLDKPESLIRHVPDREGHDRRYSVDAARIRGLGWQPERSFEEALAETVSWYRSREDWWRPIKTGEFRAYYERQYGRRLQAGSPAAR
jgi:dTDP-glucose 4,6-dehydratase